MIRKWLFYILIGIAVFFIFFKLVFKIKFIFALLIALAAIIVFSRLFKYLLGAGRNKETSDADPNLHAKRVVYNGIEQLTRMRNLTRKISNNDVAEKIQNICKTGIEIFEYVKKDPNDIRRVRSFTNYYLDATEKIITKYVQLSNGKETSEDVQESVKNVEDMLDMIQKTFEKQKANLLEDDLFDLNAEISLLKSTMKLEQ